MTIFRVESVTHGVEDLQSAMQFYEDWGLDCRHRGTHGADFVLPSGQSVRIRAANDPALPPAIEAGSTVREAIWGVDYTTTLDEIANDLSRDREVRRDPEGVLHTRDPNGFGIGFCVMKPHNEPEMPAPSRLNRPFAMPARVRPKRIGHIVYFTTRAIERETSEFYMQRLGFRLTDHSLDLGYFMRASGACDHHTLGVFGMLDRTGFGHMAFEVSSFDDIMAGGAYLQSHGWQAATKPGRHIVGSNIFWNFKNPGGGQAEYFSDMDVMDDHWQTRVWDKHPGLAYWTM